MLPQIHDEIEAIFATKTLDEWTELSAAAELTFAPVATLPEYIASEQAQAAGAVAELEHPMFPDGLKLPNTVRAPTKPRPAASNAGCWLALPNRFWRDDRSNHSPLHDISLS